MKAAIALITAIAMPVLAQTLTPEQCGAAVSITRHAAYDRHTGVAEADIMDAIKTGQDSQKDWTSKIVHWVYTLPEALLEDAGGIMHMLCLENHGIDNLPEARPQEKEPETKENQHRTMFIPGRVAGRVAVY